MRFALRFRDVMQKDLALDLGVTSNTVSYWCCGDRKPNVDQLAQIAQYLNVSADYLLGLAGRPFKDEQDEVSCVVKELDRIREQFLVPYTEMEGLIRFIKGDDDA